MVVVYRLIAKGTIEEKIQELQESKRALSEQVIQGDAGQLGGMSRVNALPLSSCHRILLSTDCSQSFSTIIWTRPGKYAY